MHENVILQRIDQGNDYGIDYYASGFDAAGHPSLRFNVQVKYLALDDVLHLGQLKNCETLSHDCHVIGLEAFEPQNMCCPCRTLSGT